MTYLSLGNLGGMEIAIIGILVLLLLAFFLGYNVGKGRGRKMSQ